MFLFFQPEQPQNKLANYAATFTSFSTPLSLSPAVDAPCWTVNMAPDCRASRIAPNLLSYAKIGINVWKEVLRY
jgi:hypothetical protein